MKAPQLEPTIGSVKLRRLKWIAVLAAFGFIILLEYVRHILYPFPLSWQGRLLMDGAILTGALFFFGAVFLIERMQKRLEQTSSELLSLHAAALDVYHRRLNDLAVSEERLRIAHEMHDGLAQVLAYVNTKAQAVREHLRAGRPEDATRHLDQLASAAREVYGDVRESIIGLRSAAVPGRTVTEVLQDYVKAWGDQNHVECTLSVAGDLRLSATGELQVTRIVQEALANVRKHARAHNVDVRLEGIDGIIRLAVQDNGIGFHPGELGRADFPRFGLATMRERAENMGGWLRLESTPGEGTQILVEVPAESTKDF